MNIKQWKRVINTRRSVLRGFCYVNKDALAEVADAKAVLEKHRNLLRELEKLEEQVGGTVPEEHVRCQAIHQGRLICDEIAPRHNLPKGWIVSVVGDLHYCPDHLEHASAVNAPTREAAEAYHQPQLVEEVVSRR